MFLQWRRHATGALCAIATSMATALVLAAEPEPQPRHQLESSDWQGVTKGKVLIVATGRLPSPLFMFPAKEGKFEWEGSTELSQLGDQATLDAGYAARNKPRFRVSEEFFGDADELRQRLPGSLVEPGRLTLWHVRNIPIGAQKVLRLRIYDALLQPPPHEILVIAFDDLPLEVMRRVALEDGVLPMLKMRNSDALEQREGVWMSGRVPNQLAVSKGVAMSVDEQTMAIGSPGLLTNMGALSGQVGASMGGGVTGLAVAFVGIAASVFTDRALSSVTIYRVTYQREGESTPRVSFQGSWAKDIRPGDQITIRTGGFTERLTRAHDPGS